MKLALVLLIISTQLFAADCGPLLAKTANKDINWRSSVTHDTAAGLTFPSNAQREKDIRSSIELMEKEIKGTLWGDGKNDTPPMIVVPTIGTQVKFTKPWEEYGDMEAEVTGAKDGILRVTVLLPVSGHTGMSNATNWAKADTYTLKVVDEHGTEREIVKDAKSLDYVTVHEVEIPLVDGKAVTLNYYRSGSGGPGGYAGGRTLHLKWNKNGAVGTTDYSKPFWGNKHP